MAEEEAVEHGMAFLKKKVGPLPLFVWMAAGLVIYLYLQHKNAGSGGAAAQTDPAGNTGTIDPATGYVYGSPEDKAALASSGGTTTDTTPSGSTIAGTYPDNNAWGRAAINYLVGIGVDPTTANEAVQQYLTSHQLTTAQQADVNLAIQSLGPPPDLPGPVGTAPGPVDKPPGKPPNKTTYASNPPTGLVVTKKTKSSVTVKWNKVAGATGYTVVVGDKPAYSSSDRHMTAAGTQTSLTVGNLKPNTAYYFFVWADPAKKGAPHAGPKLGHTAK